MTEPPYAQPQAAWPPDAQPKSVEAAFDQAARDYDQWYTTPLGRAADHIEKKLLRQTAAPTAGEEALDLGAGTGHFSLYLAGLGLRVTGVDTSAGMLARAEAKAAAANLLCRFLRADAAHLPFPNGSFDLVTCVTALEFFPEPARVLAEAWRVLRPGGRIVAGVIHRDSAWGEAYQAMAAAGDPIFSHAHLFSRNELRAVLPGVTPVILEGLHIPPSAQPSTPEEALRTDNEARRTGGRPGFLVARWDKA